MRLPALLIIFVSVVPVVRGAPSRPIMRLVLILLGTEPYRSSKKFNEKGRKFIVCMMDSGATNEEDAVVARKQCRGLLIDILTLALPVQIYLKEDLISPDMGEYIQARIKDGSLQLVLENPHDCRRLIPYMMRGSLQGAGKPGRFALQEKPMQLTGWLQLLEGYLRKPPLSSNPQAGQRLYLFQEELLKSSELEEVAALTSSRAVRDALTSVVRFVFTEEETAPVLGYSQAFVKSVLNKIKQGSFMEALSDSSENLSLLAYLQAAEAESSSAPGGLRMTEQSGMVVAMVSCALTLRYLC